MSDLTPIYVPTLIRELSTFSVVYPVGEAEGIHVAANAAGVIYSGCCVGDNDRIPAASLGTRLADNPGSVDLRDLCRFARRRETTVEFRLTVAAGPPRRHGKSPFRA
ncbi:MAG: hypothetical protein ACYTEQ_08630 [Planctomycetota bacterium]|jgi:hypothetical protein